MMLLQGPGATVTVTDLATGKPKEINFKSLGIKEDEWPSLRGEMQIRSQKLLNMIKNKSTASATSADVINKYNRSSAENISYFSDTASKKDLSSMLDNADAQGMETLIGDFVANNPGVNLTIQNFNDPNSRKEKHLFYTYIASKTGVVPESMRQKITATLGPSGIRNKANLLNFVGSPEFAVFTGAPSKITGKDGSTIQVADIFSSTGLDEDTENAALMLRRLTGFYGQEEGVNMFMQQMEEKSNATVNRTIKDVAVDRGFKTAEKLSNKIIEKIVGYYDNWGEDDIVGHNFISQVKQDVERKLIFDKEANIDDTVRHALNKIDRQGNFGFSNFSIPLGTLTTADDGVDLSDTGRIYTRFPPDDLLDEKGMEYIDNLLEQRHPDLVAKWGSDLVLGENVFLQVIGQPANEAQVAYRVVFADRTGSSQNILVNQDYNILTVSRQDLKTLDR